jgi:hypothetical protein
MLSVAAPLICFDSIVLMDLLLFIGERLHRSSDPTTIKLFTAVFNPKA